MVKVTFCEHREILNVIVGEGVMQKYLWCLVALAVLVIGCQPEPEKVYVLPERSKPVTTESHPPPPMTPLVLSKLPTEPTVITEQELNKYLVPKEVPDPHPRAQLKPVAPAEFLEGDPSPYLEFNVGHMVDPKQYSLERLKAFSKGRCPLINGDISPWCLQEEIDILILHVEALEKENERLHMHKAAKKSNKAIKKN